MPQAACARILAAVALALWSLPAAGQEEPPPFEAGQRVTMRDALPLDGDTLAHGDRRIRLFGLDAPEAETLEGWHATTALDEIVAGQALHCEVLDVDKYRRGIAICRAGEPAAESVDIAEALIAEGWAIAYRRYLRDGPDDLQRRYRAAERAARLACRGRWAWSGHCRPRPAEADPLPALRQRLGLEPRTKEPEGGR